MLRIIFALLISAVLTAKPFPVGEKSVYDLAIELADFGLSGKIGTIELEMLESTNMHGTAVQHAVVRLVSTDLIRPIFPFNNVFHSWFNPETFEPHRLTYQIRQGKWSNDVSMEIDPASRIALYTDRRNPRGKKIHLPPRAMDVTTVVHAVRRAPKDRQFDFIWIDYDRLREEYFTFSEVPPVRIKTLRKDSTVPVVEAREHIFYQFTVNLAKEFDHIPCDVIVPAVRLSRFTLVARAHMTKHVPGKVVP